MKKVLILSDSHRRNQTIEECLTKENPDCLIFCGDLVSDLKNVKLNIPLYAVKGNWDYLSKIPSKKIVNVENCKILITHGHNYSVKKSLDKLNKLANKNNANIVCYGHTHIQDMLNSDNICFINPGALINGEYACINIDKFNYTVQLKKLY